MGDHYGQSLRLKLHVTLVAQNRCAVTDDEIAAIGGDSCRTFRPDDADRSQPLPELCSEPALAQICASRKKLNRHR